MRHVFEQACLKGVKYLGQVKTDRALIGTYKNEFSETVDGSLIYMEFVRKGVMPRHDDCPEVLNVFIRDTRGLDEHAELSSRLRKNFKRHSIRGTVMAGRNHDTRVCTTTFDIEGDPDKVAITLGLLRNDICYQDVANA